MKVLGFCIIVARLPNVGGAYGVVARAFETLVAKEAYVRHQRNLCAAMRTFFQVLLGVMLKAHLEGIGDIAVDLVETNALRHCFGDDGLFFDSGQYLVLQGLRHQLDDMV